MAVAQSEAQCAECEFDFISKSADESARRGLVTVVVGAPEGGGYAMIMGYTDSRWAVLWEGNGTRNVESLPGRIAICMVRVAGRTSVRVRDSTTVGAGRVSKPTIKKAFEVRLTSPVGRHEGVVPDQVPGGPVWVQNLRTLAAPTGSAAKACQDWRQYWTRSQ